MGSAIRQLSPARVRSSGVAGVPVRAPVTAGKRAQNSIRMREKIVAAARESFCELGFGASTVRDIMRRASLAPGTFYNYFEDKDSVLQEIVVAFAARVRARVHVARMNAETLDELVREAFRATFTLYSQDRLLVTLVTRNAGDVQQLIAENVVHAAIRDLADDLRARAKEFGISGLDLDNFALAGVALAGEFGFRLIQQRPFEIDRTTDFVSDLMLGGMERMSARRAQARRKEDSSCPRPSPVH